jgi:hypothetical protein
MPLLGTFAGAGARAYGLQAGIRPPLLVSYLVVAGGAGAGGAQAQSSGLAVSPATVIQQIQSGKIQNQKDLESDSRKDHQHLH